MSIREVIADNLARLMQYAGDHGRTDLASQDTLSAQTGVEHATIDGILRQEVTATADTLEALVVPFEIKAWHLLIPDFDPSDPPEPVNKATLNTLLVDLNLQVQAKKSRIKTVFALESWPDTNSNDHKKK